MAKEKSEKKVENKKVTKKQPKEVKKVVDKPKKTKEKKENKILVWFKNNKKPLLFALGGLIVGVAIMCIVMPNRVAKLSNGEQVVLELKNTSITAEDLYEELKKNGGLSALINLMDISILNDKYDLKDEAEDYAKTQSEYYYNMYEQYYGYTKEQFLEANNFASEAVFFDYLKNEFLYERYYKDYLASIISDDEIQDYYKDSVFGARYVYVFSSTEKEHNLENVRKQLKKGTKISKLEDKYDDVVVNEIGNIDFTASNTYSEKFISTLKTLGKNQYSAVFEDDTFGYVVLYVSEVEDVPELVDVEDEIIEVISAKLDSEDETLYYKAYQDLREAYEMKFFDDKLKEEYDAAMKPYLEGKKEDKKSE